MEFVILFILGILVGLLSSFFGIGGGSLMIPVLYALFPELTPKNVIAISLGTICLTSAVNNYHFKKINLLPSKKTIYIFALMGLIGTGIGLTLLDHINSKTSKLIFATILMITVVKSLIFHSKVSQNNELNEDSKIMSITGLVGSFISSITGLGGGIVFNPMLTYVAKIPVKYVSAFSNVAMFFASLMGVIPLVLEDTVYVKLNNSLLSNLFVGQINLGFTGIIFFASIASSKIGVKYNQRVRSNTKKALLTILLLFLSLKMIIS